MNELKEYHKSWCEKNWKSHDWLNAALGEGFHIHHIDGDHENNDADNLVLIYGQDHMRLHGMKKLIPLTRSSEAWGRSIKQGALAYEKRTQGLPWDEVSKHHKNAVCLAKSYAKTNRLDWPIKLTEDQKAVINKRAAERHALSREIRTGKKRIK